MPGHLVCTVVLLLGAICVNDAFSHQFHQSPVDLAEKPVDENPHFQQAIVLGKSCEVEILRSDKTSAYCSCVPRAGHCAVHLKLGKSAPIQLSHLELSVPGVHKVGGESPPMELTAYFKNSRDEVTMVLSRLFDIGLKTDNHLSDFILGISQEGYKKVGTIEMSAVFPHSHDVVEYDGSLMEEPHTEGIRYHVYTSPASISLADWKLVCDLVGIDSSEGTKTLPRRDVQPLNNRRLTAPPLTLLQEERYAGSDIHLGILKEGTGHHEMSLAEGPEKQNHQKYREKLEGGMNAGANSLCSKGYFQSPININVRDWKHIQGQSDFPSLEAINLEPFTAKYYDVPLHIINDGRSLRLKIEAGSTLRHNGLVYELSEVVVRVPAEHSVNGEKADAEIQLLHTDGEEQRIMVSVPVVEEKEDSSFFSLLLKSAPTIPSENSTQTLFNPIDILPHGDLNYYYYDGSLTEPPCTERTKWMVMKAPIRISKVQLRRLTDSMVVQGNVRPIQYSNNRIILATDFKKGAIHQSNLLQRMGKGCELSSPDCLHGTILDPDRCRCIHCDRTRFSGKKCDVCIASKDCKSGGIFDSKKCKCNCPDQWGGTHCEKCVLEDRDCRHGTKVDKSLCSCVPCPSPWEGFFCQTCGMRKADCVNGDVDMEACMCVNCKRGWKGEKCDECDLKKKDCMHGGKLDPHKCECVHCDKGWGGVLCEKCTLSPHTECGHGGYLDMRECKCKGCEEPWGGRHCDECLRSAEECQHGSTLDINTCRCINCPHGKETGKDKALCGVCSRKSEDCMNASILDYNTCMCSMCPQRWTGPNCNMCTKDAKSCQHGGSLDKRKCVCSDCHYPWIGEFCDVCGLSSRECKNGGQLDPHTCRCVCLGLWGGDDCTHCRLRHSSCSNGGTVDKKSCSCKCDPKNLSWKGKTCDECTRSTADCQNGGEMKPRLCKCINCDPGWSGQFCDECTLKDKDCLNGGVVSKTHPCSCTNCSAGWGGAKCDVCVRSPDDCLHGSKLDYTTCTCKMSCPKPYAGKPLCGACELDGKSCQNGSTFNEDKCGCDGCTLPWGGDRCDQCGIVSCPHGGSVDREACRCVDCSPPWEGDYCEVCSSVCENGGTLDTLSCQCKCAHPWTNNTPMDCGRCSLKTSDCKNGSKLDENDCRCIDCPAPFSGLQCDKRGCPKNNEATCSGRGHCMDDEGICECERGFGGLSCEERVKDAGCYMSGDPHAKTLDGAYYDWSFAGTYYFYTNGEFPDEEVQVLISQRQRSAYVSGVAVRVGSDKMIYANGHVSLNCTTAQPTKTFYGDGGYMYSWENGPKWRLPSGAVVSYKWQSSLYLAVNAAPAGQFFGLCGNFDGKMDNDLGGGFSTNLAGTAGDWAEPEDWGLRLKVPKEKSLFDCMHGQSDSGDNSVIANAVSPCDLKLLANNQGQLYNELQKSCVRRICRGMSRHRVQGCVKERSYAVDQCIKDSCQDPDNRGIAEVIAQKLYYEQAIVP